MWCIPTIDDQFIERMEDILALYEKPYDPDEPVLCFDEKSKQLLADTRSAIPTKPNKPRRQDYEYKRNGTRNLFITVEPKGGYRTVKVTTQRTKRDFAYEIKRVATMPRYRDAKSIHIVLDNLNTHFEQSFIETLGAEEAERLMERLHFHYTPNHASWLNMAEIEVSIVGRQCLNRRIPTEDILKGEITAWQRRRNKHRMKINWRFTRKDARAVFRYVDNIKLIMH